MKNIFLSLIVLASLSFAGTASAHKHDGKKHHHKVEKTETVEKTEKNDETKHAGHEGSEHEHADKKNVK